jgi:hypothetical protein
LYASYPRCPSNYKLAGRYANYAYANTKKQKFAPEVQGTASSLKLLSLFTVLSSVLLLPIECGLLKRRPITSISIGGYKTKDQQAIHFITFCYAAQLSNYSNPPRSQVSGIGEAGLIL